MSKNEILVILAALSVIAWINWYFFFSGRKTATAATAGDGVQEATVVVRGGYEPGSLQVNSGMPVRITFDRQESSGCSEEVVFPDLGVKRFLPAFSRTTIEVSPPGPGTFAFTCGMGMLQGRLIVREKEV